MQNKVPVVKNRIATPPVKNKEKTIYFWCIAGFFLLNCCNFLLRPLRDEIGITIGMAQLQWLFTFTFITLFLFSILFTFLTRSLSLQVLLNGLYIIFIFALLLFFLALNYLNNSSFTYWTFFVTMSVFNLFSISLYWSLMVQLLDKKRATEIFGQIAASGSIGAIAGSMLAGVVAHWLHAFYLLIIASVILSLFLFFQCKILHVLHYKNDNHESFSGDFSWRNLLHPIRNTLKSSFFGAIALSNFIYAIISTFLYYEQLTLVKNSANFYIQEATFLAVIAATVNIATLILQIFFFKKWALNIKSNRLFILIPMFTLFTFLCLLLQPSILLLILCFTVHKAGNYSIIKPLREVLYISEESNLKFGTKNFVDTIFARGGDLTGSWWCSLMTQGISLKFLLFSAIIPLGFLWIYSNRRMVKSASNFISH